jgi:hypothetical protein
VLKLADYHIFSFGTRSNAFGGWVIIDINQPICLPGHLTHCVPVRPATSSPATTTVCS